MKKHHTSKKSKASLEKMGKNYKQTCKICGWRKTGSLHDICVHCNKTISSNQGQRKLLEIAREKGIKGVK